MRDSTHIIYDVCESKLAVFFSRAISAAENKHIRFRTSHFKVTCSETEVSEQDFIE